MEDEKSVELNIFPELERARQPIAHEKRNSLLNSCSRVLFILIEAFLCDNLFRNIQALHGFSENHFQG